MLCFQIIDESFSADCNIGKIYRYSDVFDINFKMFHIRYTCFKIPAVSHPLHIDLREHERQGQTYGKHARFKTRFFGNYPTNIVEIWRYTDTMSK